MNTYLHDDVKETNVRVGERRFDINNAAVIHEL